MDVILDQKVAYAQSAKILEGWTSLDGLWTKSIANASQVSWVTDANREVHDKK